MALKTKAEHPGDVLLFLFPPPGETVPEAQAILRCDQLE